MEESDMDRIRFIDKQQTSIYPSRSTSGNAFQFTETYRGPGGVSNVTVIQRNIESTSVVTSTSVFSQ